MKKLKGKTTVELTIEEVNEINELIVRNEAKAVKHNDEYNLDHCPACGKLVLNYYNFCAGCGQRLDMENYAL